MPIGAGTVTGLRAAQRTHETRRDEMAKGSCAGSEPFFFGWRRLIRLVL